MKNLLYKEIKLSVPTQTWIFVFLSISIVIPSWPSLVCFFYPLAGLTVIFALGAANRDILYTSILPLRKKDVVRGKALLLFFLELLTILVSVPFAFLKNILTAANPELIEYSDLGCNMATYGIVLSLFGLYNLIVLPWFYKKPEGKNSLPFVVADLSIAFLMTAIMCIFIIFEDAAKIVNQYEGIGLFIQIGTLLGGALLFFLLTILSDRLAGKNFQKVDI